MEFPTIWIGPIHFEFKGCLVVSLDFIQILKVYSVCKQWKPWSGATFSDVWSGFAMLTYVPYEGRKAYMR